MLQEFKDFINKGNVIEAAVGLVMALAFKPVIDAVVNNVLLQFIAGIFGEPSFDTFLSFEIGDATVLPGTIITTGLSFFFVALAMFFVVKAYAQMQRKEDEPEAPVGPTEVELLQQIRDQLAAR